MQIEKNNFGLDIRDVDCNGLAAGELEKLKDLMYRNRLIVLKDQKLSEQEYCDFANRFGRPIAYLQAHYRHPDLPLIFVSSNIKKNGKQIGVARTGQFWHSDLSFQKVPDVITMMMPKVLPVDHPRSTKFIDMTEVYAALPQDIKDKLIGAEFVHSARYRYKVKPENAGYDIFEILQAVDAAAPPVCHPAVIEHPYTGEKVLYANRGYTIGIADGSLDESAQVLKAIFDFAESDRFIKEVRWYLDDVIIWDNRFLTHIAAVNSGPEAETMMYRITLRDDFPLCASQLNKMTGAEKPSQTEVDP
jgi:taurine dioxygenase